MVGEYRLITHRRPAFLLLCITDDWPVEMRHNTTRVLEAVVFRALLALHQHGASVVLADAEGSSSETLVSCGFKVYHPAGNLGPRYYRLEKPDDTLQKAGFIDAAGHPSVQLPSRHHIMGP
jgi:hypothetical protein